MESTNEPEKLKSEIFYDGYFYDVTNWIPIHPGGNIIKFYTEKGEDSTEAIQQFHHRSITKVMAILKSLKKRSPTEHDKIRSPEEQKRYDAISRDYLELYNEAKDEGLFEPDYGHLFLRLIEVGFYVWMIQLNLLSNNFFCNTILVGLFIMLSGKSAAYLMHEYGHRSMTGNIQIDRFIHAGLMGGVLGLSSSWWNSQHNRHHAMPQRLQHDVDLDTLPLIAFNAKVIGDPKKENNIMWSNILIRNQAVLFLMIDTILVYFFWRFITGPRYAFHKRDTLDIFFMTLNTFVLFGMYTNAGFRFIVIFIIASWLTSILVFGTFTLNHSHLPVTNGPKHWVEYCLEHTANVDANGFITWFSGHLNYQIEHHLFLSCPQTNLKYLAKRVKNLAKKHNLPYISNSYFDAVKLSLNNLKNVSCELEKIEKNMD